MILNDHELKVRRFHESVAGEAIKIFWFLRKILPAYALPRLDSWQGTGERGLALIAKDRYMSERNSPTKRAVVPPLRTWRERIEHERPTDAALERLEARK